MPGSMRVFHRSCSLRTRALLEACPADIQSLETFGFEPTLPAQDVVVNAHPHKHNALQVALPLRDIIPRVNDEPAGEVVITLCEFYNRGKTQKSWEKVRRRRFWKRCGVRTRGSRGHLPADGRCVLYRLPPQSVAQSALDCQPSPESAGLR